MASVMQYFSVMMTVANILSAGLMAMSWQVRSLVRACCSDVVRLSLFLTELIKRQASFSTTLMYVSRAGTLLLGGFQVLLFLNLCSSWLHSSLLLVYGS